MPDTQGELPAGWTTVLRAIVESPDPWVNGTDLAAHLDLFLKNGQPNSLLAKRLEAMVVAGWLNIALYESPKAKLYTLAPLAAARLDCWLYKGPLDTDPRWERRASPGKWPKSCHRQFDDDEVRVDHTPVELIPDPAPGPDASAEMRERVEALMEEVEKEYQETGRMPLGIENAPWPVVVLTGSETTYYESDQVDLAEEHRKKLAEAADPEPATKAGKKRWKKRRAFKLPRRRECGCCKRLWLPRSWVCIRCLRWGWDAFFAMAKPKRKRAS